MTTRFLTFCFLLLTVSARGKDPTRIQAPAEKPADHRLTEKPRDLNQYSPFQPPADLNAWNKRRDELKVQLQVALGLWPMPPKTPLQPVIHGAIDRDGYTV